MPHPFTTRRWITIHVLAVLIVATCLALAGWQFSRLQERKADNARLTAQMELDPASPDEVLDAADAEPQDAVYRRLSASGTYDLSEEVLLRSRSLDGRAGHHLLTPLLTDSGIALIVDRGWVPLEIEEPGQDPTAPPSGRVEVQGVLLRSEEQGFLGISDPPPGEVDSLPRADLDRLAEQMPYPIYPLYLRLQGQQPANSGDLPEPAPVPEPDEGPHLSYAIQWLFFACAGSVAYVGLLRKERQKVSGGQTSRPSG